mmetsp:Transcript_21583/g.46811  ORF Transcript_21583/g.46811 Transcript_21583/m.46811 type:complete len:114 (-) Transcript_21583:806-1147(-)
MKRDNTTLRSILACCSGVVLSLLSPMSKDTMRPLLPNLTNGSIARNELDESESESSESWALAVNRGIENEDDDEAYEEEYASREENNESDSPSLLRWGGDSSTSSFSLTGSIA